MNARRQAVRDQVLRTAADLFRERGYRATTLDDIVARLGMSKASLYTYFHAKEEMLAAISRQTIVTFTRELSLVLRSDLAPVEWPSRDQGLYGVAVATTETPCGRSVRAAPQARSRPSRAVGTQMAASSR